MSSQKFRKRLSANDVGATGGHQGGVLIPKGERELLDMLPSLDQSVKNPDAWIECADETGHTLRFRFVYYNNRLHDPTGTRNEYRITHMTVWFRDVGARAGDEFEISREIDSTVYAIRIRPQNSEALAPGENVRIRLTGWRQVH